MENNEFVRVKINTNETVIHFQINDIERILDREVQIKVTLNKIKTGSSVEFEVTEAELRELQERLGYTLYRKNEAGWIPIL
jgi:hypothetical protein